MSAPDQVAGTPTDRAWKFVVQAPSLERVVVGGGATALLCALVTIVGGANFNEFDLSVGRRIVVDAVIVGGAYLAALIVGYSNMVLVVSADRVMHGDQPNVRTARARVRRRPVSVAAWILISSVATLALGFVRLIGIAGFLFGRVWAARWGLRTYLVAPVILFEDKRPWAALHRSEQLVREHWGPKAIGTVAIGSSEAAAAGFAVFFSFLGVGLAASDVLWVKIVGTLILLVTVCTAVVAGALCGAKRAVFGVALYRYVAEQQVFDRFSATELEAVAKTHA